MAIIKAVNSKASIGNAINYVTKKEKTEERLISGVGCNPFSAIEEMKATKNLWHKIEGRQYKHFIQSFSPEEKISPEQAHQIAYELVKDKFKGHEILIATHKDKSHIHSHIIVNSVNYENGRKLQWRKKDLEKMKNYSDELCRQNNLTVCKKGKEISSYNMDKYKTLEKAISGKCKSYVVETALAVNQAKEKAMSRTEFIELMKEKGYEVKWDDKRKHITFKDKEGNKVRNSNLTKTFKEDYGKESLENEFRTNEQQRKDRGAKRGKESEDKFRTDRTGKRGIEASSRELHKRYDNIQGISKRYNEHEYDDNQREDRETNQHQRDTKERARERGWESER
ncbi:relaxase/mobilization nuclease domain-containing protein [Mobilitalea sibirica]|uniref:Relaxase/mobilization nuclease domain-containing protein n=1 Tax=Mobilitalea sibirica TaxID=1462919 RepID=A0A8J7HCA3_9FIRM|nr:relaxase/mobilization nuclease domain-containing protein [Mobilitalea sibirica]MBH1942541.1 relaxase/mobilization nuclease domain-containing protein [Mobilitalea sibirica]